MGFSHVAQMAKVRSQSKTHLPGHRRKEAIQVFLLSPKALLT
jgi:hypothetical protein